MALTEPQRRYADEFVALLREPFPAERERLKGNLDRLFALVWEDRAGYPEGVQDTAPWRVMRGNSYLGDLIHTLCDVAPVVWRQAA